MMLSFLKQCGERLLVGKHGMGKLKIKSGMVIFIGRAQPLFL
jgi:hypothetical protein